MLALMTIQYALHSVNHLIDIGSAHPAWEGYFDFVSLALSTVLLAWLWRLAAAQGRLHGAHARRQGANRAVRTRP